LNHSEEVAFYNGHSWEKSKINSKFIDLYKHILHVLYRRFLFGPRKEEYLKSIGSDESKITKDYVRNTSLLINLAKAIGRIVVSYKDVQSLAGYTTLVYEMKEVLDDLEQGKYKRAMVKNEEGKQGEPGAVVNA
jgi:ATP-binding cassette subfamily D (ALD) protein 3